ncbi:hypothetical protein pEaSNUABM38_00233 [Erwinia phage pEa_SNUABM_38]|nr:hypothetical protein pEaSNUABM38_00233 [Erwinia phage pEa_SNUABM_38]
MLLYLNVWLWLYCTSVLVWLGLEQAADMVKPTPPPDNYSLRKARNLLGIKYRVPKVYVWTCGH